MIPYFCECAKPFGDIHHPNILSCSYINMQASSIDPNELVAAKYRAAGWTVIPSKGVSDMIANLREHVHFVQVRVKGSSDARYTGQGMNDFVQNAFSNGAIPIHANVDKSQVTLYDVNEDKRVLLVGDKKVAAMPQAEPAHAPEPTKSVKTAKADAPKVAKMAKSSVESKTEQVKTAKAEAPKKPTEPKAPAKAATKAKATAKAPPKSPKQ